MAIAMATEIDQPIALRTKERPFLGEPLRILWETKFENSEKPSPRGFRQQERLVERLVSPCVGFPSKQVLSSRGYSSSRLLELRRPRRPNTRERRPAQRNPAPPRLCVLLGSRASEAIRSPVTTRRRSKIIRAPPDARLESTQSVKAAHSSPRDVEEPRSDEARVIFDAFAGDTATPVTGVWMLDAADVSNVITEADVLVIPSGAIRKMQYIKQTQFIRSYSIQS
ncbi:hypothetical protein HPB47_008067 [Ixodes persulcatus]|uniref:Uncharacterized protein n=1 Tax=Ixodes persulcatus TaxID=34615 RepID=A0AC60P5T8_IXOPE|nr:hypothetical protein HPB47_008067 [Ixodes persulcatus]